VVGIAGRGDSLRKAREEQQEEKQKQIQQILPKANFPSAKGRRLVEEKQALTTRWALGISHKGVLSSEVGKKSGTNETDEDSGL
jgi:hypothetical protein